jgi:hypothetical protein
VNKLLANLTLIVALVVGTVSAFPGEAEAWWWGGPTTGQCSMSSWAYVNPYYYNAYQAGGSVSGPQCSHARGYIRYSGGSVERTAPSYAGVSYTSAWSTEGQACSIFYCQTSTW